MCELSDRIAELQHRVRVLEARCRGYESCIGEMRAAIQSAAEVPIGYGYRRAGAGL